MTTYDFQYAIRMLKDAIDFAQAEGDFAPVRKWSMAVEAAGVELQNSVNDLEEGMKLMITFNGVVPSSEKMTRVVNTSLQGGIRPHNGELLDASAAIVDSLELTAAPMQAQACISVTPSDKELARRKTAREIALDEKGNLRPYSSFTNRRGVIADDHEVHSYTADGS